jgi:hypothetical protein
MTKAVEGNPNYPAAVPRLVSVEFFDTASGIAPDSAAVVTERPGHEHANIGEALLRRQARDVATIAVANVVRLPEFYEVLRSDVEQAVKAGVLDLICKYPNVASELLIGLYTKDILAEALKAPTETLLADVNPTLINNEVSNDSVLISILKADNERLSEELDKKRNIILGLRALHVSEGATAEELRDFDLISGLITAPEREAYKNGVVTNSEQDTKGFKDVIRSLLSSFALKAVGPISPHSVELPVIMNQENLLK